MDHKTSFIARVFDVLDHHATNLGSPGPLMMRLWNKTVDLGNIDPESLLLVPQAVQDLKLISSYQNSRTLVAWLVDRPQAVALAAEVLRSLVVEDIVEEVAETQEEG